MNTKNIFFLKIIQFTNELNFLILYSHYIFIDEAEHFIWKNQEFSDIIIDTIKKSLK